MIKKAILHYTLHREGNHDDIVSTGNIEGFLDTSNGLFAFDQKDNKEAPLGWELLKNTEVGIDTSGLTDRLCSPKTALGWFSCKQKGRYAVTKGAWKKGGLDLLGTVYTYEEEVEPEKRPVRLEVKFIDDHALDVYLVDEETNNRVTNLCSINTRGICRHKYAKPDDRYDLPKEMFNDLDGSIVIY